ncbi:MAG: TldD/PmbA family protein [Bacillota bacterium]|nr:TldD/PmbA family protein [Bacillota bacterium]
MIRGQIHTLFEKGKNKGFTSQEVYYQESKKLAISVFDGQVDKFTLSEDGGMSYRVIYEGKMGYAYSERFDDEAIEMLLDEAFGNAEVIESEYEVFLHDGSGIYSKIDDFNPELSKQSIDDKIKFLVDVESDLKAYDSRIKRLSYNNYVEVESSRLIINTEGLDVEDRGNYCLAYAMPVVQSDGDTRTGLGYDIGNDFYALSSEKIIMDAAKESLGMLGAEPIASTTCPVVVKNEAFAQLFSAYMGIFSADRVQKDISALKGKIGQLIASEIITLIEDPHMTGAMASSSFDSEGVPTAPKRIIENGILKTYLYNLKTAHKDGVKSTGNASKGSYKGTIGTAPSNIYIEPGKVPFEDLICSIEEGVFIVGFQGLHSGLDSISGDFSLQCHGFEVKNGKLGKPVSQITVSGNFFEMLNAIDAIGDDLIFSIMANDFMGAPSIRINKMAISG